MRGSLRSGPGSTARRFGFAMSLILGGTAAGFALLVLALTRGDGRLPQDLSVLVFTGLLAGWVVLPILTFGSDDLLDPARLALLPLSGRQFLTVMGVGALVGVAPVATVVAALGLLPATGTGPASFLVALVAVALELALCVGASRAVVAALSGVLRSRRGRDLGVAFAAVVGLSFQLVNPLLQLALRDSADTRDAVAAIAGPLRWTPSGLLATAPGRPLPAALGSLALVAALIAVLLVLWQRSVRRALERTEVSGNRGRAATVLVPRGIPVPAGRVGAIMAKDLRYVTREPRRAVMAVTSALLPVLAVVLGPIAFAGGRPGPGLVFAVCGMGLLGPLNTANRFGLDGTPTWMLISSATDPRDARRDLLGGDLAAAIVNLPILLVLSLVIAAITGGWPYVPAAVGLAYALYGVGLGLAGLLAVNAPYAVPPSQNAFGGGGAGQGCTAGLLVLAAMLVEVFACLPLLGLLVPAVVFSAPVWGLALLVVGPLYGFGIGNLLRRRSARRWNDRAPEVLQILASARQ